MQMKSSQVMGSASAPASMLASDKFGTIGARLEREVLAAVGVAIKVAGGSNQELKVATKLKSVLEGSMTLSASWFNGNRRVDAKADLPVVNGAVVLDAKAFLATAQEAKHESTTSAQKTYVVDPALLKAKRVGNLVVMSHQSMPEWKLQISVDELKASKEAVESRITASIQGYCVGQFYRNADMMGGIKMPIVASEAPEVAAPDVVAEEVKHEALPAEQQALTASMPTTSGAGDSKANVLAGASAQWEASEAVKGQVRRSASAAALTFVGKQIQGGSPSIKEIDLSGMQFNASGFTGSAVVAIEYYGRISRENMTVSVPFDGAGRVVASGVARTQADVLAADEIRRSLEMKSEQDAKAQFDAFVAEETAKVTRLEGMGVNASADMGYGSNWIKRGPADRIPIAKTALPEEFSQVGKKILIGGLVYELQITDYNAPSFERSAHWMLELRAEIPASKADYAYASNGLGQALSSVGL
jgi:hypothetical protein